MIVGSPPGLADLPSRSQHDLSTPDWKGGYLNSAAARLHYDLAETKLSTNSAAGDSAPYISIAGGIITISVDREKTDEQDCGRSMRVFRGKISGEYLSKYCRRTFCGISSNPGCAGQQGHPKPWKTAPSGREEAFARIAGHMRERHLAGSISLHTGASAFFNNDPTCMFRGLLYDPVSGKRARLVGLHAESTWRWYLRTLATTCCAGLRSPARVIISYWRDSVVGGRAWPSGSVTSDLGRLLRPLLRAM